MKYLFLLMLLSCAAVADDKLFTQKVDPQDAPKDFIVISSALSKTAFLKSTFQQKKKIKALKRPLKSSGELLFSSKAGVYWHLQKPYQSTILINDKKMTAIDDKGKKVSFTAEEKPVIYNFTRIFMVIFTGKTEELKEHFDLYFDGNKESWRIGMTPKSSRLAKVITRIVLKGSNTQLGGLSIMEHNGDQTDINFSDVETPSSFLEEDLKKFDF